MAIRMCGPGCTHTRTCTDPQTSFEGLVLHKFEINGHDDSDFVAVVWDPELGKVRAIEYATTRGWTYHNSATIDATSDIIKVAEEYAAGVFAARMLDDLQHEARRPKVGRTVRSLTTRGKNVGIVGVVRWVGVDQYKSRRWDVTPRLRVGVKVDGEDKLRYMDGDRVEIVNPTIAMTTDEIRDCSERTARAGNWMSLVRPALPRM